MRLEISFVIQITMASKVSGSNQLPSNQKIIRIGTRESALAMAQTEEVVERLKHDYPDATFKVGTTRSIETEIL